jgi:hypothetical protein
MDLIGTTLLAALAGIDSFLGIQEFVEAHLAELSKMFDLSGGVPSHDTYRRLWLLLCTEAFSRSFTSYVEYIKGVVSNVISCILLVHGATTSKWFLLEKKFTKKVTKSPQYQ